MKNNAVSTGDKSCIATQLTSSTKMTKNINNIMFHKYNINRSYKQVNIIESPFDISKIK